MKQLGALEGVGRSPNPDMPDVDVDVDEESDANVQLNRMRTPRDTEHGGVAELRKRRVWRGTGPCRLGRDGEQRLTGDAKRQSSLLLAGLQPPWGWGQQHGNKQCVRVGGNEGPWSEGPWSMVDVGWRSSRRKRQTQPQVISFQRREVTEPHDGF